MISNIRNGLEALDYLVNRPCGLAAHHTGYHRWRRTQGLTPLRRAWWWQTRLESYTCIRRYAFLLDWAVGEDRPETRDLRPETQEELAEAKVSSLTSQVSSPTSHVSVARVIILRMGHLGDILHLMPTVREIKRQRPDWTLELVTGPWSKALAESFGLFDKVHAYCPDVVQYHRGDRCGVRSVAKEKSFIRDLRGPGLDVVFSPSAPHFCELPLVVGLQAPVYIGEPWPLAELPRPREYITKAFDSRHYEMDAVADFLPLMGLERPAVRLAYPLDNAAGEKAKAWLDRHVEGSRLVLIFPGSGWPGKNWPPALFARLADALVRDHTVTVGLAGSPGEHGLCETVRAQMVQPAHNLAGLFTLAGSAALIQQSACVIGNDSAPMHLAAALEVPTVSLWGPTFPEKWAPLGGRHAAIKAAEPCAGCLYWHVNASCRQHPGCIASVRYEAVLDAARRVMKSGTLC
ncbi:MAG TPA: glycosyltransferase family 9 protein [Kiritimatiellia bacterium]|nr:glycosyltransferase family 9 protein [Kiritimatiellia bacterium]HMO98689.1 glycosyltransferase family 9 protein [Kiritimatiellia bacterium]